MIILETTKDSDLEQLAIERLAKAYNLTTIKMPQFSAIDYITQGRIVAGVEIKTRKETPQQIREYGKPILKWRKYEELLTLSELMKMNVYVLFAFENAQGEMFTLSIKELAKTNPLPKDPPIRRNYRGLACDEEPVIYFDWDLLIQVGDRVEKNPLVV